MSQHIHIKIIHTDEYPKYLYEKFDMKECPNNYLDQHFFKNIWLDLNIKIVFSFYFPTKGKVQNKKK